MILFSNFQTPSSQRVGSANAFFAHQIGCTSTVFGLDTHTPCTHNIYFRQSIASNNNPHLNIYNLDILSMLPPSQVIVTATPRSKPKLPSELVHASQQTELHIHDLTSQLRRSRRKHATTLQLHWHPNASDFNPKRHAPIIHRPVSKIMPNKAGATFWKYSGAVFTVLVLKFAMRGWESFLASQ